MMLSDMGAEVIRVNRVGKRPDPFSGKEVLNRGRRTIAIDLKRAEGAEIVLKFCEKADALFEGFRPGVAEKLGIGPDRCMGRNPGLVYGRVTGWGQTGPLKSIAGHDINYIALSGALEAIGRNGERPVPPLSLVGDYGGGGMFLAFGIVCAMFEAQRSGKGQVVDAAMVDGAAMLMAFFFGRHLFDKRYSGPRGTNLLDTGAHFYDVYKTKDGKYISVGSIEPQFYAELIRKAELDPDHYAAQMDQARWPAYKDELAALFKSKTRDQWCALMEGSDVCFAPVLSMDEAPEHPHNKARSTFITVDGFPQPAPAPRFSRTEPEVRHGERSRGRDTVSLLADFGFEKTQIEDFLKEGIVEADS
jgi:alpha-methylacyl-CoA racemase